VAIGWTTILSDENRSDPGRGARWAPRTIGGLPDGLILFDGVCVFCSRWVAFVIKRDREAAFRFMPIQSESGSELAEALGISATNPQTNAVLLDGIAYFKSDAALMVLARLPRWRWVRICWAFPKGLRDRVYDAIAANRYRVFGRLDACMVPTPDVRARFVERLPDDP
jgi:predicted DCC family thiol-disulfide oxidoreductase YuxK